MSLHHGDKPSWPDTVQMLTEKLSLDNLPHQVSSCRRMEEKVEKVLNNLTVHKKISGWLSACGETKYGKNGAVCDKLREQGNLKFGSGATLAACKLYTQAVLCAPTGPGLGLALGNRSAALYHLGHHAAAAADIALALEHSYPRNLEYKLHLRRAQCSIRLGHYSEGEQQLDTCRSALEHAKLPENKRAAVMKDVSALSNEVARLQTSHSEDTNNNHLKLVEEFQVHEEVAGASRKLQLETSNDKVRGRYITAREAIQEGEVVFQEAPYSCVLLPPFYSSHCHHCLAPLLAPVSCLVCTQPRYCSGQCRDEAWDSYHKHECGQLDLLHSVGIGHLAVRTLLVAGREQLLSIRSAVRAGTYAASAADPYSAVYQLQHHLDRRPAEEQFQYALTAALLVTALVKNTSFLSPEREIPGLRGKLRAVQPGHEVPDDQVHYVGGLLLRHIVQLVSNAHAVTELLEDEAGSVEQARLATAIYPAASLMNHSCVPRIVNSFRGKQLTVRALAGVAAGQELTNCYGPHYRRHAQADRQTMLREQYGFRCSCPACTDTSDRHFFSRFSALRCPKCDGAVVNSKCLDCGTESPVKDPPVGIKVAMLETGDLRQLRKLEKTWSGILYRHHETLAALRDKIARLEVERGCVEAGLEMLGQGVEYTKVRYGEDSVEAGHELLKLSDVLMLGLQSEPQPRTRGRYQSQLCDTLKHAQKIFKLQNGAESKIYKEIEEKLSLCQS